MVVASQTRLVIDKNVYNLDKKKKSSFMSIFLGKARYFGGKKVGSNLIEFQVSTKTAVAGVRGDKAEVPEGAPPLPEDQTWVPVDEDKLPPELIEVFEEEMAEMEKEMRRDMKQQEKDFEQEMKDMEKEMKSSPFEEEDE